MNKVTIEGSGRKTKVKRNKAAPARTRPRGATNADSDIGVKIRLRRAEIKMSQSELAEKLGVSFQQVQKYEKGVNRVSAGRLQQIAAALGVDMHFFYETTTKPAREVESLLFLDSNFSLRLLRAYSKIGSQEIQRKFVSLMETVAGVGIEGE